MADKTRMNVVGLVEFLHLLTVIQKELPKQMQKASGRVARDWISAARTKASGTYAQQAAAAMTVVETTDGTELKNNSPIFYGMEFGGRGRPETMQFPPHRGHRGYWLFPAARENAEKFEKLWQAAFDEAMKGWHN